MASSALIPLTSISCLKLSCLFLMSSVVDEDMNESFWAVVAVALRNVRFSLDSCTVDLKMPNVTMAFFPLISMISPTELLPSMVTLSPTASGFSSACGCTETCFSCLCFFFRILAESSSSFAED